MMKTRVLTAAFAASLAAAPTPAQEGAPAGPTVETAVSAATAAVGDPITVVVTVRHAADTEVRWPDPVDAVPFELLDAPAAQSAASPDGGVESRLELRVAAFELGELSFPPLDLEVVDAGGDATALATEAVTVAVESVGRDEGGDIRDIKGPLAIPFAVVTLLPWIAALLALAAAAWLHRRRRRRGRPEAIVPAAPPRPAHEVAREALDALEAAGLLERGEIKTYHIRLSDILRVYLEGRFGVDAMEMTTVEVLDGLLRTDADRGAVADMRRVLDRCDLVKFAKLRPAVPECRGLAPLARRVVEVTAPVEPVPAPPAAIPAEQAT